MLVISNLRHEMTHNFQLLNFNMIDMNNLYVHICSPQSFCHPFLHSWPNTEKLCFNHFPMPFLVF